MLYYTNSLLIKPYRAAYSEIWIQRAIVGHYQYNKDKFQELTDFVDSLPSFLEIDFEPIRTPYFFNENIFYTFNSDSLMYSENHYGVEFDLGHFYDDTSSYKILSNQLLEVDLGDTIIYTNRWIWSFHGNEKSNDFELFLKLTKLNRKQFYRLKELVKYVDCESIEVNKDRSISLRYEGYHSYGYHYIINDTLGYQYNYLNINHADTNVYTGLRENQLIHHGHYIFKKYY